MDNSSATVIAYQGLEGSYTHSCLLAHHKDAIPQSHLSHQECITAVQEHNADYAVIPIENSAIGRITDIHHMLASAGLFIHAEYYHTVRHCLLAQPGVSMADITEVKSQPPALSQCRAYIHRHGLVPLPHADTTDAARRLSESNHTHRAVIASAEAAAHYGLHILERDIQDEPDNTTRFFLLGREMATTPIDAHVITALFYTVKNVPAALFKSLSCFATNNVNVTSLESFIPMRGNGKARFYVELNTHQESPSGKQALEELAHFTESITHLGTFTKS